MADKPIMEAAQNALGAVALDQGYALETLHKDYQTRYKVERSLVHEQGEQELFLFENNFFGRMLMLDGVTQLTTSDEPFYHEFITHVPLLCHPNPKNMLVIGAGDGGVLREAVKHGSLTHIDLVEIDEAVIKFSKTHLPEVSDGAFEDPRVHVTIEDAALFVDRAPQRFYDVVIVDSTDPFGPAAPLFEEKFYRKLKTIMRDRGIVITQCGNPFVQPDELKVAGGRLKSSFEVMSPIMITVPTYTGGQMALGFGSADQNFRLPTKQHIAEGLKKITQHQALRVLNEDVFLGAFALPNFVREAGFAQIS